MRKFLIVDYVNRQLTQSSAFLFVKVLLSDCPVVFFKVIVLEG